MLDLVWENCQDATEFKEEYAEICKKALSEALIYEGHDFDAEVNLLFTDDADIREINRDKRGIDKATDVLSFPMLLAKDGKVTISPFDISGGKVILGDIVISLERAKAQAEEYGHSFAREIGFLAVHSMLHLLGYDHEDGIEEEKIMFSKQEDILNRIGLTR